MSYSGHVDKDETPAIRHMVAICGVSGNISITTLASDKERPLADTQATTNTTTIIARADQHDIDLHKASDRVNFGSIREPIPVPYLLGVQTDSFDWLIGNERWKKRVEEDEANGTDTVPHMSGLDEVFNEISPIENFAQTMSLTFSEPYFEEPRHTVQECKEKDYTYSEQMDLSPGREGAAELLTSQVCPAVTETKIVGSKLIFKGLFHVSLLYRAADGSCCSASGELPFSQIMEVEGAPEGAEPTVRLQLTGADLQVDGGDAEGREIAVTLYLHATALLHQTQELTLLSDLYSTAYDLTYDAAPLELTSFRQQFTRRQTVREVLEIGVVADSILSLSVTCGAVSVSREGETAVLRTGADLRALYLDEGGVPLVAERTIDVSCQLELPEDCRITARAVCPEEVQGGLTDRGIEVRFPVDFQGAAAQQVKRVCVSGGKLSTDAPKDTAGAPSLVLRCLGKQETAWDLAKRYNTTIGVILSANQVESEGEIPRDQLLLIPRKRA